MTRDELRNQVLRHHNDPGAAPPPCCIKVLVPTGIVLALLDCADALGHLTGCIDRVRADIGTQFPALSEAQLRGNAARATLDAAMQEPE